MQKCKAETDLIPMGTDGVGGHASLMSSAIQKTTECTEQIGNKVLKDYFGTALKGSSSTATGGIAFKGELPLRMSDKEHGYAVGAKDPKQSHVECTIL
mmetsp:Transcript_12380/g.32009  ORF Transcript_12380/g.32009 Transcript_12380/m.32009 type:complete len:98 (-) Transcript_12380:43-336(-)